MTDDVRDGLDERFIDIFNPGKSMADYEQQNTRERRAGKEPAET